VCDPSDARAIALNDFWWTIVVAPLSIEYPIAETERDEQALVLATTLNGEVTWAPFAGEVTVIADAGAMAAASAKAEKNEVFMNMPRVMIFVRAFVCIFAAVSQEILETQNPRDRLRFRWRRPPRLFHAFRIPSICRMERVSQTVEQVWAYMLHTSRSYKRTFWQSAKKTIGMLLE
jgi:hypothetical protein